MIIVTSWDDGYPADMKIADLLDRHGVDENVDQASAAKTTTSAGG